MIRFFLIQLVQAYRLLLSPWLGSACRFEPTCSIYALQALETHGAGHGSYFTLRRLRVATLGAQAGLIPFLIITLFLHI